MDRTAGRGTRQSRFAQFGGAHEAHKLEVKLAQSIAEVGRLVEEKPLFGGFAEGADWREEV